MLNKIKSIYSHNICATGMQRYKTLGKHAIILANFKNLKGNKQETITLRIGKVLFRSLKEHYISGIDYLCGNRRQTNHHSARPDQKK